MFFKSSFISKQNLKIKLLICKTNRHKLIIFIEILPEDNLSEACPAIKSRGEMIVVNQN